MILTNNEKMKRVEIAFNLLEYAQMMEEMSRKRQMMIKNIFREKEKSYVKNLYSESKFEEIRKHHYFSTVISSFSFLKDEYIEKLKLKNIGIDEKLLTDIFVNPKDIDKYRNHNPGQNNKLQEFEIISYIRNALNHHENGVLYKYIESEDSIEIHLKNVGKTDKGEPKPFHVKVPISTLIEIILALDENESQKSQFLYLSGNIDYDAIDLKNELKKNIKVLRLITTKNASHKEVFKKLRDTKIEEIEKLAYKLQEEGKLKIREYSYDNGSISDIIIDSMYEQITFSDEDWRINCMYDNLAYVNSCKTNIPLSDTIKAEISGHFCIRNILPFGIVSNNRFFSSLVFNKTCLKSWNINLEAILRKEIKASKNIEELGEFEWFILDPIEKIFTEYENFIRYAIVNFAPVSKDNKPVYVEYNGKKYNCTFLRNAFAHGRIGYAKKGNQYMFALYDTQNGLNNEVKFYSDEDFKPKMFIPVELIRFAGYLCLTEKKKIQKEREEEIQKLNKLKLDLMSQQNYCDKIPLEFDKEKSGKH